MIRSGFTEFDGRHTDTYPFPTQKTLDAFEHICAEAPIESVTLPNAYNPGYLPETIDGLLQSSAFSRIKRVGVYGYGYEASILSSDRLPHVTHIDLLNQGNVGNREDRATAGLLDSLQAIAQNPHLKCLEVVDCLNHHTEYNDGHVMPRYFPRTYCAAIEAIANSPHLPALREIRLNESCCRPNFLDRIYDMVQARHHRR